MLFRRRGSQKPCPDAARPTPIHHAGSSEAAGAPGRAGAGAIGGKAVAVAEAKASLSFSKAFFRGVLCNVLVCLSMWLAMAARDVTGKILVIVFPISAFVAIGFEHSAANMFFFPLAMIGSPDAAAAGLTAGVFVETTRAGLAPPRAFSASINFDLCTYRLRQPWVLVYKLIHLLLIWRSRSGANESWTEDRMPWWGPGTPATSHCRRSRYRLRFVTWDRRRLPRRRASGTVSGSSTRR